MTLIQHKNIPLNCQLMKVNRLDGREHRQSTQDRYMKKELNKHVELLRKLGFGLAGVLVVGCESIPAVPVQSSPSLAGEECRYNAVGYRICRPAQTAEPGTDSCIPRSEDASMRFSMGPDAYRDLRSVEIEYFRLNNAPRTIAKGVVRNACLNMTARFSFMNRDEGLAMIECMNRVSRVRTCGAADYENLGKVDNR